MRKATTQPNRKTLRLRSQQDCQVPLLLLLLLACPARYLMGVSGLGRKSTACILLLSLRKKVRGSTAACIGI